MLRGAAVAFCSAILIAGCSSVTETGPSTDNTSKNVSTPTTVVSPKGTGTVQAPPTGGTNIGYTMELIEAGTPGPTPGTYYWAWKITENPDQKNPLNHVTLYLGECIDPLVNILGGNRSDDGIDWSKDANMKIGDDNSIGCDDSYNPLRLITIPNVSSPVGYIRLLVNAEYITTGGVAVWKAGPSCGTMPYFGMGCAPQDPQGDNEGCSYSLGFYMASPVSLSPAFPGWGGLNGGNVTVGGRVYSQATARAIFASKNGKTGMTPAKLSFLQVAAIRLSEEFIDPSASVWADVVFCDAYLSTLPVLTPTNINSFGKVPKDVQAAAGRIGQWIDSHHCDDLTP